ncbi:MAG: hypothetical protein ACRDKL_04175, partial [Solirubrobacteraceae bacterium]
SGTVAVTVDNNSGQSVATVSAGRGVAANQLSTFIWNGFESSGRVVPDGRYFFHVTLIQQARSVLLSTPVTIITQPPHPRVTSVTLAAATTKTATTGTTTPTTGAATTGTSGTTGAGSGNKRRRGAAAASGPVVLTPPDGTTTIHYPLASYRRVWIDVYRTDLAGRPRLVNQFTANPAVGTAHWNGDGPNGEPVAAGTYLIGITAQDQACNQASYPTVVPPAPGTTPRTGVTVRYLTATPPLVPTAAGTRAPVAVYSPTGAYTWQLRLAGRQKLLRQGSGVAGSSTLRLWLPPNRTGLYTLTLRAGSHTAAVPLVADAPGRRGTRGRQGDVLVILPMLTWQGANPVDDTGDGLPSTLTAGERVALRRPLAHGLPLGYRGDAVLLRFLNSQHLRYQMTTDVALAVGRGPSLVDRWGVVLAGDETWLPAPLVPMLKGFVEGGGRVLSIGTDTLQGSSKLSGYPAAPVAAAPVRMGHDLFGAQHGPQTSTKGDLITELSDQLDIFAAAPAFPGFDAYTPIEPPAGAVASLAGVAAGAPAVAAFMVGKGYVVEVGLAGFNRSLATNVDAQELLGRVWQLLAR